MVIQIHKLV